MRRSPVSEARRDEPHVSLLQCDRDSRRRTHIKNHFFESSKNLLGLPSCGRISQVELRLLGASKCTGVRDSEADVVCGAGLSDSKVGVCESCVGEAIAKLESRPDVLLIHVAVIN